MLLNFPFFLVLVEVFLHVDSAPKNPKRPTIQDYCEINATNTPCKYKCVRDDARCDPKYPYKYKHFSSADRKFTLHRHNSLRNAFAGGAYKAQGFPEAADMMVLSWDKECEFLTGCYALQCTWAHDTLRHPIGTRYPQGQNLYRWKSATDHNVLSNEFYNTSMNNWFDEYKDVTAEHIKMMTTSFANVEKPMIGHFTQFIWAQTKFIGCAKYMFHGEDLYQLFFFCNYYPPGNFAARKVYTPGKPASKCPDGTKPNKKYPNLCGNIRNIKDDKYVPPIDFDPEGTRIEKKRLAQVEASGIDDEMEEGAGVGDAHETATVTFNVFVVSVAFGFLINYL